MEQFNNQTTDESSGLHQPNPGVYSRSADKIPQINPETLAQRRRDEQDRLRAAQAFMRMGPPGLSGNKQEVSISPERTRIESLLKKVGMEIPEGYEPVISGDSGFTFDEKSTDFAAGKLEDSEGNVYILQETNAVGHKLNLDETGRRGQDGEISQQAEDASTAIAASANKSFFESVNAYRVDFSYDAQGNEIVRKSESPSITIKSIYLKPKSVGDFVFPERPFATILIEDNGNKVSKLSDAAIKFWRDKIEIRQNG